MQCKAKSKRSGQRCKNYAVHDWEVCRFHGARAGRPRKDGTPARTTLERRLMNSLLRNRSTGIGELQNDIEIMKMIIFGFDKKLDVLIAKQETETIPCSDKSLV